MSKRFSEYDAMTEDDIDFLEGKNIDHKYLEKMRIKGKTKIKKMRKEHDGLKTGKEKKSYKKQNKL